MKLLTKALALTSLALLAVSPSFAANEAKNNVKETPKMTQQENVTLTTEDLKNLAYQQADSLAKMLELTPEQLKLFAETFQAYAEGKLKSDLDPAAQEALSKKLQTVAMTLDLKRRAEADAKAVEKFLADHKDAVKEESGLVYVITNPGTGKEVKETDNVNLTYEGSFTNGQQFDAGTHDFPLQGVIPGFRVCASKLKEGGEMLCLIPSDLAYGDNGAGPIPPKATLMFKLKVNKINEEKPADAAEK